MPGYAFFLLLFPYLVILWFLRRYRIWLLYYILGTAGLAYCLTLFLTQVWDVRSSLASSVALSVHFLLDLVHIDTRVVENAPGALLVLVLTQRVGWTVLQIGVESSGLLEMVVLSSLALFYPGWSVTRRIIRGVTGLILTWGANLLRMLIIATLLHFYGKEVLVLAHTFLGKLVFFILTLAIYWALITFPSLRDIETHLTRYGLNRA